MAILFHVFPKDLQFNAIGSMAIGRDPVKVRDIAAAPAGLHFLKRGFSHLVLSAIVAALTMSCSSVRMNCKAGIFVSW